VREKLNKARALKKKLWQCQKLRQCQAGGKALSQEEEFKLQRMGDSEAKLAKLLADPELAKLLADPELAKLLADPELAKLLADPELAKLLAGPSTPAAIADEEDYVIV